MFPVFLPKSFTLERIQELFNRVIQMHKSHAAKVKEYEIEEGLIALIPDESDAEGIIIYLTQAEINELDEMNAQLTRIHGHCDNNIQCYIYTTKED